MHVFYYAGSKGKKSAKKTQSEPCPQEISKSSSSRPDTEPECGRKLSDLSIDKSSTVDSLDDDVAIIDVGSPSCEQYRAADKATPLSSENRKRGLDTPVAQSESKVSKSCMHKYCNVISRIPLKQMKILCGHALRMTRASSRNVAKFYRTVKLSAKNLCLFHAEQLRTISLHKNPRIKFYETS